MDRDEEKERSERSRKLFALLVLTGASLAVSLSAPACSDNNPPPVDAGEGGGGAHFW